MRAASMDCVVRGASGQKKVDRHIPEWDPIRHLPETAQRKLSAADRENISTALTELRQYVASNGLDHVPVFGYLSLPTNNFRELGKASQDEVEPGRDVVPAKLEGHGLDVVASTVFRGTPTHPGTVAGLRARPGETTPGAVLRVPLGENTEKLLAVLLQREFFAEADLQDSRGPGGERLSNAMYLPVLREVTYEDGTTGKALLFITNPHGAKAITGDAFVDDTPQSGLTPGRLAYLIAGHGGFMPEGGTQAFGGPSQDYWTTFHLEPRADQGRAPDPLIEEAVGRARAFPADEVVEDVAARAPHDSSARAELDSLLHLVSGAAVPLALVQEQKPPETLGLTRVPNGKRTPPGD